MDKEKFETFVKDALGYIHWADNGGQEDSKTLDVVSTDLESFYRDQDAFVPMVNGYGKYLPR